MSDPVIRVAGGADARALAALRRAWTAEESPAKDGQAEDADFEARFLDWYARESPRRVCWMAEVAGQPVGMMNLAVFERMPRPGREAVCWGYLANAFVLAGYRNRGIGARLLRAVLAHAGEHQYARVVLRPSDRAVPFYERLGFAGDHELLVWRPAPAPG
jgi:GNAT superfamily N-acetyltransferase